MLTAAVTDDIRMTALEPWHAKQVARFVETNRAFLEAWMNWPSKVDGEDSAREVLRRGAEEHSRDESHTFGLWDGDKLAGGVALSNFNTDLGLCEIAAWLGENYTKRGIMTTACDMVIDWAISQRGMNRVEWRCVPGNMNSAAVARRLGMTLEGTLREAFRHNEALHDLQVWALLASEWPRSA